MSVNRRLFLSGLAAAGASGAIFSNSALAGAKHKHREPIIVDGLDTSTLNDDYVKMMRQGGVHCVHQSVGDAEHIGEVYHFIEQHSKDLALAKSVADIHRIKNEGKIAMVLGKQSPMVFEHALRKERHYRVLGQKLRAYHGLGLRVLLLAYNNNNIFAGGNLNPSSPLTRAGRVLVEEVHKAQIILDVGGHVGERSSLDAIALSSGIPVICSHTNMAALMPNVRAISDKVCEAIAGTGGVIGITAISDFHTRGNNNYRQHGKRSPHATMEQHLDQYDYVKKLVGIDHVGLGSDFVCGWGEDFDVDTQRHLTFPPEMLSNGSVRLVKGYKDISEIGNVIKGLKKRGWNQQELNLLLGGNWLRVYKQVWGG